MASKPLVVIGGGAAGMSAASAARRVDPDLEIVVLEAGGYSAYGMCGLPYLFSGAVARPDDLVAYPPAFFRNERRIDLWLNTRATRLEPDRHVIHYRDDHGDHRLIYHRVIIAAGGRPTTPPIPGLDHERVFTVRRMEDAITLRSMLDAGHIGRALVVGAG